MKKFTFFLSALLISMMSFAGEVEMSTFTATSADMDGYISYSTNQGGGTTAPAINNGVIRLYQNNNGDAGGNITIAAKPGATITAVTIGSDMDTQIKWEVNGTVDASTTELKKGSQVTISDLSASAVTCHCYGADKSHRLYVNYLKIIYAASETPGEGGGETPEPTPDPEEPGDDVTGNPAATIAAGENGSACTVNGKDGIKVGASKSGGNMTITVPANATALQFYAAAWNKVTGLSINITPADKVATASIELTADAGIANSSPFTLSGEEASFYYEVALNNITEETTLTVATSIEKRFVIWGVTYTAGSNEGGETPDPTPDPEPEPDPEPTPDPEEPETPGVGGDEAPVDGIVIFDANNDHGTASTTAGKYTISKNGVTMGVSNGRLNDAAGGHYRIYKDAKLTITSTVGNIASVEITFIAEGESQYGSAYIAEIEGYTYDGFVGTWTGNSTELVLTTTAQVRVTQIVVTLAEQGDDFVLAPSIAGEVNFLNSTTVTITAEAGLDIYYTLDGTEPTNASTKYTAPFELTETKTVKAIACDGDKASSVVSKTFTKTALIGCAEASALASGKVAYMKPFDVVYVVEGAGYIYIQDETGVALIYDYNLDDQLKAGDHVEGFVGKSSPYNGLPELKPEGVTYDDLTVTPGTAPAPTVVTTVPVAADVNKYVQFNGVSFKDAVSFTSDNATNVTMLMGETEVTVRNSFKLEAELDADTMYNVVGFVAIYNSNIQIYFLSATESNNTGTGLDNITIDTNITKTIVNGQLIIIKNGVKYNVAGAVVK